MDYAVYLSGESHWFKDRKSAEESLINQRGYVTRMLDGTWSAIRVSITPVQAGQAPLRLSHDNLHPPVFDNYNDAQAYQLQEWVEGRPWHNPWAPGADTPAADNFGGQCCPDFSCCRPDLMSGKEERLAFAKSFAEGAHGGQLHAFLCTAIEKISGADGSRIKTKYGEEK